MNVISNENKNFVFEFSEFEFSELECFGLISHSLIIVLHAMHGHTKFSWTHQHGAHQLKKREAGNEKIKMLDEVKKRKQAAEPLPKGRCYNQNPKVTSKIFLLGCVPYRYVSYAYVH